MSRRRSHNIYKTAPRRALCRLHSFTSIAKRQAMIKVCILQSSLKILLIHLWTITYYMPKFHAKPLITFQVISLLWVPTHKYLGVPMATDQKDDRSIRQQCRNIYSRGNTIIRNFKHRSDAVKWQLFKSFCTSFYCASLWSSYTTENLHRHLPKPSSLESSI